VEEALTVLSDILSFVAQTLLGEFLVVVAGVLFAHFIQNWWEQKRYGQWRVRILQGGEMILDREISARKAKEILEEPAELSVFLKGVVSPYAWVRCDILKEGIERRLLVQDREQRIFFVDLDKNPAKENGGPGQLGNSMKPESEAGLATGKMTSVGKGDAGG
jgi:hypothetical protein